MSVMCCVCVCMCMCVCVDSQVMTGAMADYVRHVQRRIQQENDRVTAYLDETTRRPLLAVVHAQLVTNHVDTMLRRGMEVTERQTE
jgi:hypothetical protein